MRVITPLLLSLLVGSAAFDAAQASPMKAKRPAATATKASAPRAYKPRGMVAAANPLAVEAGLRVLREGGSAVDAAVAIQAVLGLVEPQSSGLGGGSFMVFYDAKTGKVTAYDGREKAPMAAGPDLFLGPDGQPLNFVTALLSGRSTGVPGAVGMLAQAQKEHGRIAWSGLFKDAEKLADGGFTVSPRLAGMINSKRVPENVAPDVIAYFTKPNGQLYQAGDTLKNPAYAATLRRLAAEGPSALYEGPIAQAIVDRLHQGELSSSMTLEDLKAYKPRSADALCHPWKVYTICVPNPSSSGVSLLQALMMLEHTDIAKRGPKDAGAWTQLAQAERVMYADRDRYVGDPSFVKVPIEGLLEPAYVAERAKLIGNGANVGPAPTFGLPKGAPVVGPDSTNEVHGTTHMVIVDAQGNAVSMTTTVESVFGSGRMVNGFFLNNQLTDFNFAPVDPDGAPGANAVAGGKRPRSSMAPVIILDKNGKLLAALGSPGGSAILSYNLKTLVGVFDWGLSMQQAINLPNMVARGDTFSADVDRLGPDLTAALQARGVAIKPGQVEGSGLHGVIVRAGGVLEGGADPRREGVAKGL